MKIKAALLTVIMCINCIPSVYGNDEYVKLPYNVNCERFVINKNYGVENLSDGNENSYIVLQPAEGAKINITSEQAQSINKVRIAFKNFAAWQNVKEIKVSYGQSGESVAVFENKYSGTLWGEFEINSPDTQLEICINKVYENSKSSAVAISEIELYGKIDTSDAEGESGRRLTLNNDFTIIQSTAFNNDYPMRNLFDGKPETFGVMGPIKESFLLFQFKYPTDISRIELKSVFNGTYAVVKKMNVSVYNLDVGYRQKLVNPSPVDVCSFDLQNNDTTQAFAFGDTESLKGVTHLMVRFPDTYMNAGLLYGGIRELAVYGGQKQEGVMTSQIISHELLSNSRLLQQMGIVDLPDEVTEEFLNCVPTRLEAAKAILKLTRKYDTAVNYKGTYNFKDAVERSAEDENIMSYIFAHKNTGVQGDNGYMNADAPIEVMQFYKMLLCNMGYEYNSDFTWDGMEHFLRSRGIGAVLYEEKMTFRHMYYALYEFMSQIPKGDTQKIVEKMYADGYITEDLWNKYNDKADIAKEMIDGTFDVPETLDTDGNFVFRQTENGKYIGKTLFAYNAVFHFPGIKYGTLPDSNPHSLKKEYSEVIKKTGAKALRFPGGLPCHNYFMEGEKYVIELNQGQVAKNVPNNGGYMYDSPYYGYYVDTYDFLDFCCENDIEPIFQVNMCFYVDEKADKVRAIYPSVYSVNTDGEFVDGIFDRIRIEEAAVQLGKNIDRLLEKGYKIKYWELGNEDYYVANYLRSGNPRADTTHPATINYMNCSAAFAKVIREKIPDAYIIATKGFPNMEDTYKGMGVYDMIDSLSPHYPFAVWPGVPADRKTDLKHFVYTNDVNFAKAGRTTAEAMENDPDIYDITPTESAVWQFANRPGMDIQQTFAMALSTVHNWGQSVFETPWVLHVLHDLESPFFGGLQYNIVLDPGKRYTDYVRGENNEYINSPLAVAREDVPASNWFLNRYYVSPAMHAFNMLSEHTGHTVLNPERTNAYRLISAFASVKDDEVLITITNRLDSSKEVCISLPELFVKSGEYETEVMQSDFLTAIKEEEYNMYNGTVTVSEEDSQQQCVRIEVPSYSITNLAVKVKNTK